VEDEEVTERSFRFFDVVPPSASASPTPALVLILETTEPEGKEREKEEKGRSAVNFPPSPLVLCRYL
jgi:hypothetical protein